MGLFIEASPGPWVEATGAVVVAAEPPGIKKALKQTFDDGRTTSTGNCQAASSLLALAVLVGASYLKVNK